MDFRYLFWRKNKFSFFGFFSSYLYNRKVSEKYLKYLLQILFSFSEMYLEPSQISKVELFAKIVNGL